MFYNHALAPGSLDAADPISLAILDPEICHLEAGRPAASSYRAVTLKCDPVGFLQRQAPVPPTLKPYPVSICILFSSYLFTFLIEFGRVGC
jgi:hypothetical protein